LSHLTTDLYYGYICFGGIRYFSYMVEWLPTRLLITQATTIHIFNDISSNFRIFMADCFQFTE
jgi:hypothetical protein